MYIDYVYIVLFYMSILYNKYRTKRISSIYNYVIIILQYIIYLLKF